MVEAAMNILTDLQKFIRRHGNQYQEWFCGTTSDPKQQLFELHRVDAFHDPWMFRACQNISEALELECTFLREGCQGIRGKGDWKARYIYIYKISQRTQQ
jgi:hypothetical protein